MVEIVVYDVFSVADTVSKSAGGTFDGNITAAGTLAVTGIGTFSDDIIIGDGKTIGSASKTDAITIAASGNTQLRSTGIAAGSQVFQIIDDGTTVLNVRSEDGNINFPVAGGGIFLGVTAAASSNLLNDYEEGTWTPTLQNYGGTPTIQSAIYTKVGRLVYASCAITLDGTSDASGFVILTLPFTSLNSAPSAQGGVVTFTDSDKDDITILQANNAAAASIMQTDGSTYTYNEFGNDKQLRCIIIYSAA